MFNENVPFLGRDAAAPQESEIRLPDTGEIKSNGVPKIRVMGVGGAGNNAVNRMIDAGIRSADFIAVNTDAQTLLCNKAATRIQIGYKLTNGLGAGAEPEVGRAAAEESKEALAHALEGTDLLFITAGMGGGTGTGAAPVIAKIAREKKILTVAVVTEPFEFEGRRRMENAMKGIDNLRKYVDTLVIIPNEKIRSVVDKTATLTESFAVADDVLKQGIRGIADLIVTPALINLDFADVKTVLKDRGLAHMGVGVAKGENRIVEAVRLAVNSPLLETTIEGATGVIINVVGGPDLTLDEYSTACDLVHGVVDYNCLIVSGACVDPNVHDEVEVTVIATGFPSAEEILTEIEMRRKAMVQQVAQRQAAAQQPSQPQAASPSAAQPQQQSARSPLYPTQPPYVQQTYSQPQVPPQPQTPQYPAPQEEYIEPPTAYTPSPEPEAEPPVPDDDNDQVPAFVRRLLGKKRR